MITNQTEILQGSNKVFLFLLFNLLLFHFFIIVNFIYIIINVINLALCSDVVNSVI